MLFYIHLEGHTWVESGLCDRIGFAWKRGTMQLFRLSSKIRAVANLKGVVKDRQLRAEIILWQDVSGSLNGGVGFSTRVRYLS